VHPINICLRSTTRRASYRGETDPAIPGIPPCLGLSLTPPPPPLPVLLPPLCLYLSIWLSLNKLFSFRAQETWTSPMQTFSRHDGHQGIFLQRSFHSLRCLIPWSQISPLAIRPIITRNCSFLGSPAALHPHASTTRFTSSASIIIIAF
jgi:hypothetical protein